MIYDSYCICLPDMRFKIIVYLSQSYSLITHQIFVYQINKLSTGNKGVC